MPSPSMLVRPSTLRPTSRRRGSPMAHGVARVLGAGSLQHFHSFRLVLGEVFGSLPKMSDRVVAIQQAMAGADIQCEAVGDGRPVEGLLEGEVVGQHGQAGLV